MHLKNKTFSSLATNRKAEPSQTLTSSQFLSYKKHFVSVANTGLPNIETTTVYSEHLAKHKNIVWVNARVSETGAMYRTVPTAI